MNRTTLFVAACLFWPTGNLAAHELQPALLDLTRQEAGIWSAHFKQSPGAPHLTVVTNCEDLAKQAPLQESFQISCRDKPLNFIQIQGLIGTLVDVIVSITEAGITRYHLIPSNTGVLRLNQTTAGTVRTAAYLRLGVQHLLFGFDHVLFVLLLLCMIQSSWKLAGVITSFTLAHSLTLGLSTLGHISLPQASVEALIALSILLLAREVIIGDKNSLFQRYPWLMSFVFGLLHGFGFASVLTKIGLPQEAVVYALLFFNLGIEAGQLMIVAAALLLVFIVRKLAGESTGAGRWPVYIAVPAGGISLFWFVERALPVLLT